MGRFQSQDIKKIHELKYIKASTREELYIRIHLAKEYIDSCFKTNITLEKLASIAMLNPYYFLKVFKSVFKCTPHKYIINKRIDEAQILLKKGVPVNQISTTLCFYDLAAFSNSFKKRVGVWPEEYKKMSA